MTDWKTGFAKPTNPKTDTPKRVANMESEGTGLTNVGWTQWLVYSFLAFNEWPDLDYVIFRERHVLWKQERYAVMRRWQKERYEDELAVQVALMDQALEEGISSERWVASGGSHCALCPRPWDCPIMDLEQVNLHTEAGRRQVASEWLQGKAVMDARRAVLEGIVDAHGPQAVRGAEGLRYVGWKVNPDGSGKRSNFGVFDKYQLEGNPWDDELAAMARQAGVLAE